MKWIVRVGVGVVVLVIAAVVVALLAVDRIAKAAVEQAGSAAVGVPVSLASISVRPLAGAVTLSGLAVANPPGYGPAPILRLDTGEIEVRVASLLEEQVRVPRLVLDGIEVRIEQKVGRSNLKDLIDGMPPSPAPKPGDPPGKRFFVDEFVIRDVRVNAELLPIGGQATSLDFRIAEIRVKELDSDDAAGVLLPQLTHQVTTAILAAVVEELAIRGPANLVAGLGDALKGLGVPELTMQVGEGLKQIGGSIVSGTGQAVQQVGEKIGEGVGDAVRGIGEGLGGLFGDQKKD